MQTATADPLVGRLLEGRYRILDRIARGGMSTVYAAVDERLDRRVAVKVMSSSLSADPKFSDRFAREARAAARLTHVNTVAVYDQGVDDSAGHHVFLVMELVQGRTLRDLIRERAQSQETFSPAEAVSIMEPVLSALSAAHRAGLVHRDVKPENILLSDDGLVKVADFGLARAIDADAASTRTGLMMGTVAYCAPEQIVHGIADQRSDVYSSGIVLFELLTGRPPFQGDSAMNVAYQHVHSRVPAPSSRIKGIPTPIDEIVVAATDSDPTGRPNDASTFLAELADTRASLALPVVPVPPRRRPHSHQPPRQPARPAAAPHHPTVGRTGSTAPVRGPARRGDTARTDALRGAPARHDTALVDEHEQHSAPAPPVVIPPRKRVSPAMRRRRRRLIALICVLTLAALSVCGGILGVRFFREWNTHVPKVAGYTIPVASDALRQAGYAVSDSVTSEFSETVPRNYVIGTDPKPGARLAQGKTIRLVVSLGKDRVQVPDISNMAPNDARSTLQNRGLTYPQATLVVYSESVPSGYVIRTQPAAGQLVKPGSTVQVTVSKGKPPQKIPPFTDAASTSCDDVSALLTKRHFAPQRIDTYSDSVPSGNTIAVSNAGSSQPWGSTVQVTCSKGPQYVQVPDYQQFMSATDLQNQLEGLGLKVNIVPSFGGVNAGRVLSVDPAAGTQVRIGDTVTIHTI